jgi:adenylate cyclase
MDAEPSIKRRLAAILAADIAGYGRLMGKDEAATVRDLKGHQAVILPLVSRHGGRIIDTAGDGILAEFPSVIGATECAVEIQTVMAARNEDVPEHRRMLFRIGINLGDVIHDETRIYGDGINVAARLEGLAEPAGVLVSRAVHDQVRDRLDLAFEDLGERELKNIARPVRVYRVRTPAESKAAPALGDALPLPDKPSIAGRDGRMVARAIGTRSWDKGHGRALLDALVAAPAP